MPTSILRRAPASPPLSKQAVRLLADDMLLELGLEQCELSVLLTDDRKIRVLNREHRGFDKPTDVLSFPLEHRKPVKLGARSRVRKPSLLPHEVDLLGDVVISLDTAERQARGRNRPLFDEVRFLLAHGLLHLLGHDHATRVQKRRMDRATRQLVRASKAATHPKPHTDRRAGTSANDRSSRVRRLKPVARSSRKSSKVVG